MLSTDQIYPLFFSLIIILQQKIVAGHAAGQHIWADDDATDDNDSK